MGASALVKVMETIGNDILETLKESNEPLSQDDLFEKTKLKHYVYDGYAYAIDYLMKRGLIEYSDEEGDFGTLYYQLKKQ